VWGKGIRCSRLLTSGWYRGIVYTRMLICGWGREIKHPRPWGCGGCRGIKHMRLLATRKVRGCQLGLRIKMNIDKLNGKTTMQGSMHAKPILAWQMCKKREI